MMSNGKFAGLRPHELAAVWGTAFGQLVELWRAGLTALLEIGSGESTITGSFSNEIEVPAVGGHAPRLIAQNLVGESFGYPLPSNAVIFAERGSARPGHVLVDCWVDESRVQPIADDIKGDIYRGEVVDAQDQRIALIALDVGS
jgi:hypothetical protein